jgi:HJR/Mrr/RecB family endonuclease
MIYNFRFDRERTQQIVDYLKNAHQFAQGWGGGSDHLPITIDNYQAQCKEKYNLTTTRIPTNLLRMRNFQDGDILVTPHLPCRGKVSIHIVDGSYPHCYQYVDGDREHLNHRVKIKASYGLDGSISIYNHHLAGWYGKLPWMRLPIFPLDRYEEAFKFVVNQMSTETEQEFGDSSLDDYLEQPLSDAIRVVKDRVREMSPHISQISFERLCEYILSSHGYTVTNRNIYNRQGGDLDIICVRDRTETSPFEAGQTTLCVQVKKHNGVTDKTAVDQIIQMMRDYPGADGCVMSLGDGFTEEAQQLAQLHGVLLMNGDELSRLLLKALL